MKGAVDFALIGRGDSLALSGDGTEVGEEEVAALADEDVLRL